MVKLVPATPEDDAMVCIPPRLALLTAVIATFAIVCCGSNESSPTPVGAHPEGMGGLDGGADAEPFDATLSSPDAKEEASDGIDRTSVFCAHAIDPYNDTWVPGGGQFPTVLFEVTAANHSQQRLASVTKARVWFEGGTPMEFDLMATPVEFQASAGQTTSWDGSLQNDPVTRLNLQSPSGSFYFPSSTPFSPFAEGDLHIVMRGTFVDGKAWECSKLITRNPG